MGSGTGVDESILPEIAGCVTTAFHPVIEGSAAIIVGDAKQLRAGRWRR